MQLASPWLLLLLGVLPAIWWVARSPASATSRRAVVVRCLVATLLVIGASGPQLRTGHEPVAAMFVFDRSDSIGYRAQADALARANAMAAAMQPADRAGVVVFGGDAVIERRPSSEPSIAAVASTVDGSASNLEMALALARATFPDRGRRRIVLFSDGRETQGSAATQAALAAADGMAIDVVMAQDGHTDEVSLVATAVVAPADVRVGEPFQLSVTAGGAAGMRGVVTLVRDGLPAVQADLVVGAAGRGQVQFLERRDQAGMYAYTASVRQAGEDAVGVPSAGTAGAVVAVSGEPSVLYVSRGRPTLAPVLSAAGFQTTSIRAADLPTSGTALARHDAVVLDGVEAEQLSPAQAKVLVQFVEQSGGGLLLLGTSRSLDPLGFPETPLGAVLPVDLRPRTGRRAPSLALVVLVDKTGSMADVSGGASHIELARRAVVKVLEVLPATDSLGIIAFDAAAPVLVAPLGPSHDRQAITERLRSLEPSGGTVLAPAIEQAVAWLRGPAGAESARRHILLISDGRTTRADAERVRGALKGAGVELSAVAVGKDADRPLLEQLARATGGRAHFPDDLSQLPLIVAREAAAASSGRTVDEPFVVRASTHPVLAGLDRTSMPTLSGYTVSAAKPAAETILSSHLGDPVLAAWRVGLGKVGVVTADLGSAGSRRLHAWTGFAPLWTQTMRWLGRRTDDRALDVQLAHAGEGIDMTVEAHGEDGSFLNGLVMRARVRLADGDTKDLRLPQIAPGRYHARLTTALVGPYTAAIGATDAMGQSEYRTMRGGYRPDRERLGRGTDIRGLERLAEITGGNILTRGGNVFTNPRRAEYADMAGWCLTAALLLFVADIIVGSEAWAALLRARWLRRAPHRDAGTERAA